MQIESLLEKVPIIGDKAKEVKLKIKVKEQLKKEMKHPPLCQDCPLHRRDPITSLSAGVLIRETLMIKS